MKRRSFLKGLLAAPAVAIVKPSIAVAAPEHFRDVPERGVMNPSKYIDRLRKNVPWINHTARLRMGKLDSVKPWCERSIMFCFDMVITPERAASARKGIFSLIVRIDTR